MPRVSEFYGIVIAMYHREHPPPHFHAIYGEYEAVIGIDGMNVLEGRLPRRARNLVVEWAALHQGELMENWQRVQRREAPTRIMPLN